MEVASNYSQLRRLENHLVSIASEMGLTGSPHANRRLQMGTLAQETCAADLILMLPMELRRLPEAVEMARNVVLQHSGTIERYYTFESAALDYVESLKPDPQPRGSMWQGFPPKAAPPASQRLREARPTPRPKGRR
jgi:hypothetical protein